jgi:hypothetical protein
MGLLLPCLFFVRHSRESGKRFSTDECLVIHLDRLNSNMDSRFRGNDAGI